MAAAELLLAAVLALHIAACAMLCGSAAVRAWVAPLRVPAARLCAAVAASGVVLLALQTWAMDGGDGMLSDVGAVLLDTRFGAAWLWRLGLCLAIVLLLRAAPSRLAWLPALLGLPALATFAATGHPAASGTTWFAAVGVLHVVAGLLWVGALPALWLALPVHGASAARRFAWLGGPCVALVAVSALIQAWLLGGPAAGLLGSWYGVLLLLKAALFLALCWMALGNFRGRTAALSRAASSALPALRRAVLAEAAIGAAIIVAAALLSRGVPSAHLQPDWPFAWRPSLAAFAEPELAGELFGAFGLIAAALLLAAAGWRLRLLPAVAIAAALALWGAPSLGLLLVPAYPTSYARSPTDFSAASVIEGGRLYPVYCESCHRADAHGGPIPGTLDPAADLMAPHLWDHADGELFWWIAHGMNDPEGAPVMPGFADHLDDDQIWALIDYIRGRNAGLPADPAAYGAADIERQVERLGLRRRTQAAKGMHHHHV